MIPFYRRSVTGPLQRNEFLMNGRRRRQVKRTRRLILNATEGQVTERNADVRSRAETKYLPESPAPGRLVGQSRVACSSRVRTQWPIECEQMGRGSARGRPSVADQQLRPVCRQASRPIAKPSARGQTYSR